MDVTRDIDNYSIEVVDGRKVIHYNGFTWLNQVHWPDEVPFECDGPAPEYVAEEMTFCYVPLKEYDKERLASEMELVQQYQYPLATEKDVLEYLEGAVHLPLNEVDEDTPLGSYWCYLEEE